MTLLRYIVIHKMFDSILERKNKDERGVIFNAICLECSLLSYSCIYINSNLNYVEISKPIDYSNNLINGTVYQVS